MTRVFYERTKDHADPSQAGLILTVQNVNDVPWIIGTLTRGTRELTHVDRTTWVRSLAAVVITRAHQASRMTQLDVRRISKESEWIPGSCSSGPISWIPFRCRLDQLFPNLSDTPQYLFLRCRQFTSDAVLLFDEDVP